MQSGSCAILIKSFSGPSWYEVDLDARTCDCPQYRTTPGEPCKHLNAVGIYRKKRPFFPSVRPTFSQALSGLVKSIRLRREQDAVYWLVYLDTFKEPADRNRVARRLLIASAEDGHSVEVMEEVARKYTTLARKQTDILHLAAEALRICKMPNWWNPSSGGPDYIYKGLLAERFLLHYPGHHTLENMTRLIVDGIANQDGVSALAGVFGLEHAGLTASRQAELLGGIAVKSGHALSQRLVRIHLNTRSPLSSDNNFLCQAVWMMCGGNSPVAEQSEPVLASEVFELLEQARGRWRAPKPIPRWCCDGLHSAGDDVRFMGVWFHMHAACLAYQNYGRLNPEDAWRQEFHCYDGLTIRRPITNGLDPAQEQGGECFSSRLGVKVCG
jgi:hypothetical protein